MIGLFKTDIATSKEMESVETMLLYHLGFTKVTCDSRRRNKTLYVESPSINPPDVINLLSRMGYNCQAIN